jgi:hypothetical protein
MNKEKIGNNDKIEKILVFIFYFSTTTLNDSQR